MDYLYITEFQSFIEKYLILLSFCSLVLNCDSLGLIYLLLKCRYQPPLPADQVKPLNEFEDDVGKQPFVGLTNQYLSEEGKKKKKRID